LFCFVNGRQQTQLLERSVFSFKCQNNRPGRRHVLINNHILLEPEELLVSVLSKDANLLNVIFNCVKNLISNPLPS